MRRSCFWCCIPRACNITGNHYCPALYIGCKNPADVFMPCIIATYVATVTGMIAVAIKQKINLFDRVIIGWLGGLPLLLVY
jgi:hypothetical protein